MCMSLIQAVGCCAVNVGTSSKAGIRTPTVTSVTAPRPLKATATIQLLGMDGKVQKSVMKSTAAHWQIMWVGRSWVRILLTYLSHGFSVKSCSFAVLGFRVVHSKCERCVTNETGLFLLMLMRKRVNRYNRPFCISELYQLFLFTVDLSISFYVRNSCGSSP